LLRPPRRSPLFPYTTLFRSMTMSAVVTTYVFGRVYFALTGTYFFYDSYIPISVFLGMHLLFNDPATSPRTELGRIIYGSLYGLRDWKSTRLNSSHLGISYAV